MTTREDCAALDARDPLAGRRALFDLPAGVIYLDGNSLGALPHAAKARLREAAEQEWGQGLIRSWNSADWINLPARVGAKIAALIGAEADEVTAADSTSINVFKLVAGALAMRPERRVIVTEPGNFPTDLYMLQGLAAFLPGVELRVVEPGAILAALDESVAALLLTQTHYRSGRLHDMAGLTAKAHAAGALAIWDLSHSAGAIEVDLNGAKADLAVGCGYKYLNGGPGAPAFAFIARRHQAAFRSPLTGWMGHAAPFEFSDAFAPANGIKRALCGTPPVLGLSALEGALTAFDGVTMAEVRAKSVALGELFIALMDARCAGLGFSLVSPRNPAERGSQLSWTHPEGYAIVQALIARGVIPDYRAPQVLRFGLTPLYVRFLDIWDAVEHLVQVMQREEWREERFKQVAAVT
ncbi:kynureninase [Phenylobacterium montanum]|uniref:Kynureninase n=1 Tax=Phenylobacterium montanum TaxID=2823693 RepID=A0A975FY03_9CAUL|nr:kynureninase [Caulobacter sp. S6]QUD87007.1 kynureninase [Caulobacter sp. S6]